MVLLKNSPPVVTDFYRYMQTKQVKEIIKQHGYVTP
jgi:hypothetical protein